MSQAEPMIELADKLLMVAQPLMLVSGIVALIFTLGTRPSRRVAPFVTLAVVLLGEIWWILFYAQGLDNYFQDGTTRWEFAATNREWVVAALVIASASVVLLLISALFRRSDYFARISLIGASASSFMLLFAWFVLTAGH